MVEYFDVVDEHDRVTGRATRNEVHARGEWHRAVYVFVFNSNGELFIQHRSEKKDREPNLWTCSVSGHLSSGETYTQAALKETREEIGVDVNLTPLFYIRYPPSRHHLWIFRATHDGPFALDPEEVKEGRFVSLDELNGMIGNRHMRFVGEFIEVLESFNVLSSLSCCSPEGPEQGSRASPRL